MNVEDFTRTAVALLRTTVGWQSKIARLLGCNSREVRRWLKRGWAPPSVAARLAELMELKRPNVWPRDEWLIGWAPSDRGGMGRRHIVHLQPPRFVARIVQLDEDGRAPAAFEEPVDMASFGTRYQIDVDLALAEIEWFDQPRPGQVTGLLEAAGDAVESVEEALYWLTHPDENEAVVAVDVVDDDDDDADADMFDEED
jgi:hypothetical protein